MKTYYVVALMQLRGFNGMLPYIYNVTYKSKEKAMLAKEEFESSYPQAVYAIAPIDLPVHPGDNLVPDDTKEKA